jgi:hypothetical protein
LVKTEPIEQIKPIKPIKQHVAPGPRLTPASAAKVRNLNYEMDRSKSCF